jgi:SsrA-binding protein
MGKAKKKIAAKKKAQEVVSPRERIKLIVDNRKARHLYFIDEEIEAGLVLTGTEVKSCRQGRVQLKDAYAINNRGEFFLHRAHISVYDHGNINNHEPERQRKVLLHKHQIKTLYGKIREKGYTLVPLKLYFKGAHIKVLLGLARGKKLHDKRASLRDKQHKREIERAFKHR